MVMLGKKFVWANLMAIGTLIVPSIGICANIPLDTQVKTKVKEASKKQTNKKIIFDDDFSNEAAANIDPIRNQLKANDVIIKKSNKAKIAINETIKPVVKPKIKEENNNKAIPVITKANLPKTDFVSEEQMMLELGLFGQDESIKKTKSIAKPNGVAPWQKIGSPYQINGTWYIPAFEAEYDEIGVASWYGDDFNGKATANGEVFDMNEVSIAHPTLPLPSMVEIINLENGRSIIARVNDRGPFKDDRLIDVSKRTAELLGFKDKGKAKVRVKYIGYANPAKEKQNTIFALDKLNPKLDNPPTKMANNEIPKQISVQKQQLQNKTNMVQIGAFINKQYAEKFISSRVDASNLTIVEADTNVGKFFRVYDISNKNSQNNLKSPQTINSNKIDHNSILASL